MHACQHCSSTEVQSFTPDRLTPNLGAILLCRHCERITVALPDRRQPVTAQRPPMSSAA